VHVLTKSSHSLILYHTMVDNDRVKDTVLKNIVCKWIAESKPQLYNSTEKIYCWNNFQNVFPQIRIKIRIHSRHFCLFQFFFITLPVNANCINYGTGVYFYWIFTFSPPFPLKKIYFALFTQNSSSQLAWMPARTPPTTFFWSGSSLRALRIIYCVNRRHPSQLLFAQTSILSVYQVNQLQIALFLYSSVKKLLPQYFCNLLTFNDDFHQYPISSCFIRPPYSSTTQTEFSVLCRGSTV